MIKTTQLGKRYRLQGPKPWHWALQDIHLSVGAGQSVGIIGRNGSGKSTLLKLISRITHPTTGKIELSATPTSLLELGAGFHSELTGRENIFLNGLVLGMSKAQIKGRLEAIIDLSEIGPFLDMPLKRYSSGMTMRLAFAIATQIETELLIVDEVMAVGDVVFQKKSTEHLALKSRQGTTVLFVSHNLGLINSLCTRAIWLDEGRLVMEGPSKSVTRAYLEMESQGDTEVELTQGTFSSDEFRFHRIAVKSSLNVTTPIEIELSYEAKRRFEKLEISIEIFNHEGVRVCSLRRSGGGVRGVSQGRHEAQVKIPPLFLVPGSYFLDLVAHIPNIDTLVQHSQAIRFEVEEMGSTMTAYRPGSYGVVFLNAPWVEKSASATVRNELDEQYLPRN